MFFNIKNLYNSLIFSNFTVNYKQSEQGTGTVHELVFDERQPVPGVHFQHFDIVPRLMPVMRESEDTGTGHCPDCLRTRGQVTVLTALKYLK